MSDDVRLRSRAELMELLQNLAVTANKSQQRAMTKAEAEVEVEVEVNAADDAEGSLGGESGGIAAPQRVSIGMVGYPNVGKSSCINVLLGATPLSHGKRAGNQDQLCNSSTPQLLNISEIDPSS